MNYSKALTKFLSLHPDSNAIDNLPVYLGTNWETIVNFWSWIDTLTVEQWDAVGAKYMTNRDYVVRSIACDYAEKISYSEDVQYCTWFVATDIGGGDDARTAAILVSYELLALQHLLNSGHKLYCIPLFNDL
jgi:hypothetical protein